VAEAFAPGERVAILIPNGISHIAMDQAAAVIFATLEKAFA